MSIWFIFTYISEIFRLAWVYSLGRFSKKWSVDSQPCDIEAGIPTTPVNVPAIIPVVHEGVDLENVYIEHIPNPFLDRHLSIASKNNSNPAAEHESEYPVRRPSRRHSMIIPLKSRIVDVTSKNIQNVALDKIRSVTVTCAPVVAVACSAQIEYFEDHVASAANVEWFDPALHQPSYAQEVVYHGSHTPSSAKIEYFDSDVAEFVEESSFSISSESAGFSSVEEISTESGYDFPLAESNSALAPQVSDVRNDGSTCATVPLREFSTAVPFAEGVEAETPSGPVAFMATPSLDSVSGRVPIKGGLKYSHRRYSTCDSSIDIMEAAATTLDMGIEIVHASSQPSSRARIQDGIKYSHRRYSAWRSSDESSSSGSGSGSTYRPDAWDETASTCSTGVPFSGSPEAHPPALFVLDGKDFVEDSAEWSSQCVDAMDAVGISVSGEPEPEPPVVETREDRLKRISRESLEQVEFLQAQMEARFEAAFKKAGIPWVPTKELLKSPV